MFCSKATWYLKVHNSLKRDEEEDQENILSNKLEQRERTYKLLLQLAFSQRQLTHIRHLALHLQLTRSLLRLFRTKVKHIALRQR